MPFFKTTRNIFVDFGEYFDPNWMDSDRVILPFRSEWDYSREMKVEDVDIWEVVGERGGGNGIYASWSPFAEFYMIRAGWQKEDAGWGVETYYGPSAQKKVMKRMRELDYPITMFQHWVEPEDMWLFEEVVGVNKNYRPEEGQYG